MTQRARLILLLHGAAFLAAALLLWRAYHLPLYATGRILFRDDTAVLSERAWFTSDAQWLRHLLFFNQTRITAVGDYVLVRPLLFAATWTADVLFRSNRGAHYWLSMAIALLALAVLIRLGSRSGLPPILSVPVAISLFLMQSDSALLTWSHITPYLFALALPIWGMLRITSTDEDRIDWGAILLFVLATGFHEAAALGLLMTGAVAFVMTRRRRKWFAFHFLFAGALYLLLYAVVMLAYRPPIAPQVASGAAHPEMLTRIAEASIFFLGDLVAALPHSSLGNVGARVTATAIFWIAVCAAIAWCAKHFRNASSWADRWLLASIGFHFAALFGGYAIARFGTRPVQTWYLQMAMYYLLAAGLVVFGVMYRGTPRSPFWRTLGVALAVVLWSGDYAASAERAALVESQWTRYHTSSEVVRSIAGFVERTQTCFAGSVGRFSAMSNVLSILLYYESCAVLRDREPVYFEIGSSGGRAFPVHWAPAQAHRAASLRTEGDCVAAEPAAFAEYHLFLANRGSTPYRYPMSLIVQYADQSRTTLAFNDNEFFTDDRSVHGHLLEIAASMHVSVRPSPAGVRIFSGSQLLAELPANPGPIGIRLCKPPWIEARAALVP